MALRARAAYRPAAPSVARRAGLDEVQPPKGPSREDPSPSPNPAQPKNPTEPAPLRGSGPPRPLRGPARPLIQSQTFTQLENRTG